MDPVTGAALMTGAADFLGGLWQNKSNSKEARLNRDFQERMSSTAAQRAVKDYAAAGLNPALAYDRPASSPGGSQAQMENPVGKAVSSGMAAAQLENLKASTAKMKAEATSANADAAVKSVTVGKPGEHIPTYQEEMQSARMFRMGMQPHQLRAAEFAANLGEFQSRAAQYGLSKAQAEKVYYDIMGAGGIAVDQLSGPVGDILGLGTGALRLLGRGGMTGSSAKGLQTLFKKPLPRRTGDWEGMNRNPAPRNPAYKKNPVFTPR